MVTTITHQLAFINRSSSSADTCTSFNRGADLNVLAQVEVQRRRHELTFTVQIDAQPWLQLLQEQYKNSVFQSPAYRTVTQQ